MCANPDRTTSSDAKLKIIVVGAGLSGLSAAISCSLAGHDVVVLEGAKELAEVCTYSPHFRQLRG